MGKKRLPEPEIPVAGQGKIAHRLSAAMEREIWSSGALPGTRLGTESELIDRYKVSRSVLREALALVARSGLAEMRRGKQGGLYVADRSGEAVEIGLAYHLDLVVADVQETTRTRQALEEAATVAASRRMTAADLAVMQDLLNAFDRLQTPVELLKFGHNCFEAIAKAAHNPLLSGMLGALRRLLADHLHASAAREEAWMAHAAELAQIRRRHLQWIIAGAPAQGVAEIAESMRLQHEIIARHPLPIAPLAFQRGSRVREAFVEARQAKLAEDVASVIRRRIIAEGLAPGQLVGFEASMLEDLKVGRSVLREALRILEQHSVITIRAGKGGGIRVRAVDSSGAIARVCNQLLATELTLEHVMEVLEALDLLMIDEAAEGVRSRTRHEILAARAALDAASPAAPAAWLAAYHQALAILSGRCANNFLFAVALNLVRFTPPEEEAAEPVAALSARLDDSLAAVLAGDAMMARRHMLQVHQAMVAAGMALRPGEPRG